jgi:hypothetical protein
MRLCGFEVGLDRPLFVIAGLAGVRSRAPLGCDRGGNQWAGAEVRA